MRRPLDAIVIDPPWGGPGYVEKDRTELFMSEKPLRKIITEAAADGLVSLFMYDLLVSLHAFDTHEW